MNWQEQVRTELTALIMAATEEKTRLWETGEPPPGHSIERVTADFIGEQYAPWYDGGVWRGEAAEWIAGTLAAAKAAQGQGFYWEIEHLHVLPRSPEEAAVMYEIRLNKRDCELSVAVALFLETWVKQGDSWHLTRHRAEKARP